MCPVRRDIVACASYELDEASGARRGKVYLYGVTAESKLVRHFDAETPGVLDLKWCSHGGGDAGGSSSRSTFLGAALANGSVAVYAATGLGEGKGGDGGGGEGDDATPGLGEPGIVRVVDEDDEAGGLCLCLSLDWNNRVHGDVSPLSLATSQSNSNVSVVRMAEAAPVLDRQWRAHDLYGADTEVWITAYNGHHPSLLLSGADDSIFKGWDLRGGDGDGGAPPLAFKSKEHDGGVCSIQSHPHRENLVATGSYDGNLRIWDTRNMMAPVCTSRVPLGGGVWRIKWHPDEAHSDVLLSACMRGGVHLVRVDAARAAEPFGAETGGGGIVSALNFEEHGSENLAYGVDWSMPRAAAPTAATAAAAGSAKGPAASVAGARGGQSGLAPFVAVSCSFYNRELRTFTPYLEESGKSAE